MERTEYFKNYYAKNKQRLQLQNKLRNQRYRKEGHVSKNGIPSNNGYALMRAFTQLVRSGNKKEQQMLAQRVYTNTGEGRKHLESLGVALHRGKSPFLELPNKVATDWKFGFSKVWVKIQPVAYKLHFVNASFGNVEPEYITTIVKTERGERWVTEPNPNAIVAYWIFDRYQTYERILDFPEVRPEFHCAKCDVHVRFNHLDDMFVFQHKCIDPMDRERVFWFGKIPIITTLRKVNEFVAKYNSTTGIGFSIESGVPPDEGWSEKVMGIDEVDYD